MWGKIWGGLAPPSPWWAPPMFPTIRLPNGNVVKFSQTNQKHFAVGDPMAFPVVKMGNKNPQNVPFPLHDVGLHLIQQCLGLPHPSPQTASSTVEALCHTYAIKSPLVTMVRSTFAPKSTPSRGPIGKPQYLHHPWTRPTYGAKRLPEAICCFSTMHWTDGQTDRQTDRPTERSRESSMTIGRSAQRATRPNNKEKILL